MQITQVIFHDAPLHRGKRRFTSRAGRKLRLARSSGESETTHVGEVCQGLTESPITELERDLIVKAADKTKAAAIVAQRVAFPILEFTKWMLKDTKLGVKVDTLKFDASVARAVSISGQSKEVVKKDFGGRPTQFERYPALLRHSTTARWVGGQHPNDLPQRPNVSA